MLVSAVFHSGHPWKLGHAWEWYHVVWLLSLLVVLALVRSASAAAILVNSSLTLVRASASSVSRVIVPFKALVSSPAAFKTSVSGVTCGFVMY